MRTGVNAIYKCAYSQFVQKFSHSVFVAWTNKFVKRLLSLYCGKFVQHLNLLIYRCYYKDEQGSPQNQGFSAHSFLGRKAPPSDISCGISDICTLHGFVGRTSRSRRCTPSVSSRKVQFSTFKPLTFRIFLHNIAAETICAVSF